MPAVPYSPRDWESSEVVMVQSDASDQDDAKREIDDWAAAHGFARTPEYWLPRYRTAEGRTVFRGICYRLTPEYLAAVDAQMSEIDERRRRMAKRAS